MDSSTASDLHRDRLRRINLVLLMGVMTLCAYSNSFGGKFTFDDKKILRRPETRYFWPPEGNFLLGTKRALVHFTLAANYKFGGFDVRGYHIVNIAIHLVAGMLLFGLVRRTLRFEEMPDWLRGASTPLAFASALLWLIHPIQTQCVTYIIQRCESLMGLFYIASLYCLLRGAQSKRSWPWYLLVVAAVWLGMLSKEVMVTAPLALLLFDRIYLEKNWRNIFRRRLWVHGAALAASCWLVWMSRGVLRESPNATIGFDIRGDTPLQYLLTQPGVILHYLQITFWPDVLLLDYYWPRATALGEILPQTLAVGGLLLFSLFALFRWPRAGFLGILFFLILAPTSSFMPIVDRAFDHRMYLPLACVILLSVCGMYGLLVRLAANDAWRKRIGFSLVIVAAAGLAGRTYVRNADYLDMQRFWRQITRHAPHNFRAHHNLGTIYFIEGRYQEAIREMTIAAELAPRRPEPLYVQGIMQTQLGNFEAAIDCHEKAIAVDKTFSPAYVYLGDVYSRLGEYDRAAEYHAFAAKLRSDYDFAWLCLGVSLYEGGKTKEGISAIRKSLEIRPSEKTFQHRLAWIVARGDALQNQTSPEAVASLKEGLIPAGRSDKQILAALAAAYEEVDRPQDAAAARKLAEKE